MRVTLHACRRVIARLYRLARGGLALFGLAAILPMVLPLQQDMPVEQVVAATVSTSTVTLSGHLMEDVEPALDVEPLDRAGPSSEIDSPWEREMRAVAEFIAQRYRVAGTASAAFVSTAYRSAHEYSLDPLLILAVMAVESRYNPVAESSMGAKGLMQIIPRYHGDKLMERGGEDAVLDPEVNIEVGAQILHEYLSRAGALETALQMYNGALHEPTARYAGKVLAERERLQYFLAAALGEI